MPDAPRALRRRAWLQGAAAACVVATAHMARADATDPVRLVVPFGPGGRTGFFASTLAPALEASLGRPVRIDYREGAGPMAEIAALAKASPDGRTLLLATVRLPRRGTLHPDAENRLVDSLVAVTLVARDPMVLLMNPRRAEQLGIGNVAQLLRHLRARPGQLSIATAVDGSTTHLATELFKSLTRTWLLPIPASGLTPDAQAVSDGRLDLVFASLHAARGSIRIGEFRALGVSCDAADPAPALDRLGMTPPPPLIQHAEPALGRFAVYDNCSLLAPPGTPAALAEALQQACARALATPSVRAELLRHNAVPGGVGPARYRQIEDEEAERWRLARARW